MELNVRQIILLLFLSVITVELLGVISWWLLAIDPVAAPVFIIEIVLLFVSSLSIITFRRKKGTLQTDERIERYNERSVMVAGIAGLLMVLQITVAEIITGLAFSSINILFITWLTFFAVLAIANFVQSRSG
ncbi:MAG: hypothetical protein ACFFD4_04800 [Candidatus Odinarchaeota archaeon]